MGFAEPHCGWLVSYFITHSKTLLVAMVYVEGRHRGKGGALRQSGKHSKFLDDSVLQVFFLVF